MRRQEYPSTMDEAETLIRNCGCRSLCGTADEVEAAAVAECEATARRNGWKGPWEPQPPDCEYVQAHLILAGYEAILED